MPGCLYTLLIGKRHSFHAPSSYRVCITENQAQTLFGHRDKVKPEGCGVFACVYPHTDPRKVVKITSDASDVAGLMKMRGSGVTPDLYEQFHLAGPIRWTRYRQPEGHATKQWGATPNAWALVLERLRPLTRKEKSVWANRVSKFRGAAYSVRPVNKGAILGWRFEKVMDLSTIAAAIEKICPVVRKKSGATALCRLRMNELTSIVRKLKAQGVEWTDIHVNNIGIAEDESWKALDLGAASTQLSEHLPLLEGARRGRKRYR